MNQSWNENNKKYWDDIAGNYDNSYNDLWSLFENKLIRERLRFITYLNKPKILDLGCGTGLGYAICNSLNGEIQYTGVDISQEMLAILAENYPNANLINSAMSDLSAIDDNKFDVVLSLFTAFSYTDDYKKTISEISRVTKPNGIIFLSVISKYSLRRLIKFKCQRRENYKTRGVDTDSYSYSWSFSKRYLFKLFNIGFTDIKLIGYNPFGGIYLLNKNKFFWKINLFFSKILPSLSHELLVIGRKNNK